ncbi:hypothetical protein ABK040_002629 [Willaertia magna]
MSTASNSPLPSSNNSKTSSSSSNVGLNFRDLFSYRTVLTLEKIDMDNYQYYYHFLFFKNRNHLLNCYISIEKLKNFPIIDIYERNLKKYFFQQKNMEMEKLIGLSNKTETHVIETFKEVLKEKHLTIYNYLFQEKSYFRFRKIELEPEKYSEKFTEEEFKQIFQPLQSELFITLKDFYEGPYFESNEFELFLMKKIIHQRNQKLQITTTYPPKSPSSSSSLQNLLFSDNLDDLLPNIELTPLPSSDPIFLPLAEVQPIFTSKQPSINITISTHSVENNIDKLNSPRLKQRSHSAIIPSKKINKKENEKLIQKEVSNLNIIISSLMKDLLDKEMEIDKLKKQILQQK